jgi:hypothetical protein
MGIYSGFDSWSGKIREVLLKIAHHLSSGSLHWEVQRTSSEPYWYTDHMFVLSTALLHREVF